MNAQATTSAPLLIALERAHELALEQEVQALLARVPESERSQRGIFGPSAPGPLPPEQVRATLERLDKVSDQITVIRELLLARPELLLVLDESIRQEYRQMERRTNLTGFLTNAFFTLVGAFIGYWLPIIIQWLAAPR